MRTWLEQLDDDDLGFIKRFVVSSGSLKAIAKIYGISYPTVRLRLDRLIEKIRIADDQEITSGFERLARMRYAEGRIDNETFAELLEAHQQEVRR